MKKLDPAAAIIWRIGGAKLIGDHLGMHRNSVMNWAKPVDDGGTGGIIPAKRRPALIALAQTRGVRLADKDFEAGGGDADVDQSVPFDAAVALEGAAASLRASLETIEQVKEQIASQHREDAA